MIEDTTLVQRVAGHGDRVAVIAGGGRSSYRDIDAASSRIAAGLRATFPRAASGPATEPRVAFSVTPCADYVSVLLGIWKAGGLAVPLALSHPEPELAHAIADAEPSVVVVGPDGDSPAASVAHACRVPATTPAELLQVAPDAEREIHPAPGGRALMLYTSGTTGRPKGVVLSHANLGAQISTLVEAWEWRPDDRALLVLPLHHVHGIVNVLASALWSGATCEMLPRFDAEAVWARLASGDVSVFTAVPTIYHRLIESWDAAPRPMRRARSEGSRRLRLMMSGSAALPVAVLERWREITGHTLLERYGMTEIGMALSNPLHDERRPGTVGAPLPHVTVRLIDEDGAPVPPGTAGGLEVRGPSVFLEYWRQPEATREAFRDGWFRTGDVAVYERGVYRLLGRASVDIIKTGGYKVSALEIEEVLRRHPAIADCAVVAVEDAEWGERICAAVELRQTAAVKLDELQHWARSQLAPYKVPRDLRCLDVLPRNAMGKVMKPVVAGLFAPRSPGV